MSPAHERRDIFRFDGRDWRHFVLARSTAALVVLSLALTAASFAKHGLRNNLASVLQFILFLETLGSNLLSHYCEWLIIRGQLPQGRAAWYTWPAVNLFGVVMAGAAFKATYSVSHDSISYPFSSLADQNFGVMIAYSAFWAAVAAALPAYWLYKSVAASSWPYLMMRSVAGGLNALLNSVVLRLSGVAFIGILFADSPQMLTYSTLANVSICLLALCTAVMSAVLEGGGLWFMARRAPRSPRSPHREEP